MSATFKRGIAMHLFHLDLHPVHNLMHAEMAEYRGRKLAIVEDAGIVSSYIDETLHRQVYPSRAHTLPERLIKCVDATVDLMIQKADDFKPGMTVRIVERDPSWQRATCAEPMPGMTAKVVAPTWIKDHPANEGMVQVEFDEVMLGYERSDDGPINCALDPNRIEVVQ